MAVSGGSWFGEVSVFDPVQDFTKLPFVSLCTVSLCTVVDVYSFISWDPTVFMLWEGCGVRRCDHQHHKDAGHHQEWKQSVGAIKHVECYHRGSQVPELG